MIPGPDETNHTRSVAIAGGLRQVRALAVKTPGQTRRMKKTTALSPRKIDRVTDKPRISTEERLIEQYGKTWTAADLVWYRQLWHPWGVTIGWHETAYLTTAQGCTAINRHFHQKKVSGRVYRTTDRVKFYVAPKGYAVCAGAWQPYWSSISFPTVELLLDFLQRDTGPPRTLTEFPAGANVPKNWKH